MRNYKLLISKALSLLTLLTLIFTSSVKLYAVQAKGGVIKMTQADGTIVEVKLYGDEHFNWKTTTDGYPIAEMDGFLFYAKYSTNGKITLSEQRVSINGRKMTPPSGFVRQDIGALATAFTSEAKSAKAIGVMAEPQKSSFPSQGEIRSAVILVEYADLEFTVSNPNQAFYNQLNEEGYSVSGATGSAKDYFAASSGGQFSGQFDVYGPYKLSNNRSYYGGNNSSGNDMRPDQMIWDAVEMADADGVDFSQYDFNEDGVIDNIFVYYAGHNEAEGGSSDSVWPHKWAVYSRPVYDGKYLYEYACTSELRNATGSTIAGIGTFCHEFSHVFGLADHYDTDYYSNGYSYGLGEYDIMSSGSYNNSGNTPPLHNALEMDMIGWATPTVIDVNQSIAIEPIQSLQTYKILTEVDGEYFLIENRNSSSIVWDEYIPADGLIISHIDRSTKYMSYWNNNAPNKNPSHECFRFINAGNATVSSSYSTAWAKVPYPYNSNDSWGPDSTPKAESWAGEDIEYQVSNITRIGENITFYASNINYEGVMVVVAPLSSDNYVGEGIQFQATIYPFEDNSQEVTWKSSDQTIATVSSDGYVEFLSAGEVKISATSVESPESNGSYTITAIDYQGARGYVYDSDGNVVSNTGVKFYYTEQVVGLKNVVSYTRTTTVEAITATTNSEGFYRVELPEGHYEVEASGDGLEDLFTIIDVEAGSNLINLNIDTYIENISTYLTHVEGDYPNSFYGNRGSQFCALTYWSSDDLSSVVGEKITRIKAAVDSSSYITFVIYKDDVSSDPIYESTQTYNSCDALTTITNDIAFDKLITIEEGCGYYIGYSITVYQNSEMPAAITTGSSTQNEYLLVNGELTALDDILEVKGNWNIGFYTQDEDQSTNVKITPGQTSAILTWSAGAYSQFKISYGATSDSQNLTTSTSNEITLSNLEPYTTYQVSVSGATSNDATYTDMFTTEFTTYAQTTAIPVIKLPDYEYTTGELLELEILNTSSSDDITWYYDGEKIGRNKIILSSGEHMISCTVERGNDTYRVTRYIKVN